LHLAVKSKDLELVKLMLKRGNRKLFLAESSALSTAIDQGPSQLPILRAILDAGFPLKEPFEYYGSPMMSAAAAGVPVMKELLAHGASVHWRDRHGNTPILAAKTWEAFSFLVSKGADPLTISPKGLSPLFVGDMRVVRYLLDKGANPNQRTTKNSMAYADMTVLMQAAYFKDLPKAKLLLERGADPRIKNSVGKDALYYAKESESMDMVQLILSYLKKK
jgi:ankyrin repeat protein